MSRITLDGQAIRIEGPLPQKAATVFNFITSTLEANGRCLTTFRVDGIEWLKESQTEVIKNENFSNVEAQSLPLEDVLLNLINQSRATMSNLHQEFQQYTLQLISEPWPSLTHTCGQLARHCLPMIHTLGVLGGHTCLENEPWQAQRRALLKSIESIMEAYAMCCEKADPQQLTKVISNRILPWIQAYSQLMDEQIAPSLVKRHAALQSSLN